MGAELQGIKLSAYVPNWVAAYLRENRDPIDGPFARQREGTVLFLDLAGFTEMTERLARLGARGAEELCNLLNDCFSTLTDVLHEHGGDVIAFAGDGILTLWQDDDHRRASQLAAQCGLALQDAMNRWVHARRSNIRQRISIECGAVFCCKVGGLDGRWLYLVAGTPIHRVACAYRRAGIGDVLLCQSSWNAISASCEGKALDDLFRLDRLTSASSLALVRAQDDPPPVGLDRLVPKIVVERATLGRGLWLGEYRNASILQITLLDATFDGSLLQVLHRSFFEIQRIAARLEGSIYQALMDDKGVSVSLAFGLPPLAHEEDPLRAIEAALSIQGELSAVGMRTSIGIASGRLFCGDYGGRWRRAYGVMGQAANLAARLMEAADGAVICDAVTAEAVNRRVAFAVLPPFRLKGYADPIPAFRPLGLVKEGQGTLATDIVGREPERARLKEALQELRRRQGKLILVRGEAGIGKSRVLTDFAATAESMGFRVLQGFATAIEKSTLYFAWRSVLLGAIDLDARAAPGLARTKITELLGGSASLRNWMPLLEAIIPLGLAETPFTEQISGAARAASIEELVVELLTRALPDRAVLVFEDLHWFDSASASLLGAVLRRLPHLLVVASSRPGAPFHSGDTSGAGFELHLDGVSRDAMADLIRQRLRATDLPTTLVDFVYRQTSGNPFYCEELVFALRDSAIVTVTQGTCHFSQRQFEIPSCLLSKSLEGTIVSRIDLLSQQEQLVLKIASTMGETFSTDTLASIDPELRSPDTLARMLDRLVEHDILRIRTREPSLAYSFRHAISQEVVYNLLPFAQRRALHQAIASSMEKLHAGRLEPFYAQLARHWEHADEPRAAIGYLELAAERALRSYANLDAIQYATRALHLARRSGATIDDSRRAAWEVILGDAYHELADYDAASVHYEDATAFLGHSLPGDTPARLRRLLADIVLQVHLRVWRPRHQKVSAPERVRLQRIAHIYERLSEEYFYHNDALAVLSGTMASLNAAERGGAMAETVSGYSALALGLGMSGMVRAGRSYGRRALGLAQKQGGLSEMARVQLVVGVLGYGLGDWVLVADCAKQATSLYRSLGDRARWQNAETMSIFAAILRGDLDQAERRLADLSSTISSDSSIQVRAWALSATTLLDSRRGAVDVGHLKELRRLAEGKLVRADKLLCLGAAAAAYLQANDMASALETAEHGLHALTECQAVWGGYVYGAAGVVDVLLAHWEHSGTAPVDRIMRQKALTACDLLSRFARNSPVCRPRALLSRGRAAFLRGSVGKARRHWQRAAAVADRLEMRHDYALALYQIGRSSAFDDPMRPLNLARAAEIFEQLGARADLAHARVALSASV